MDHKQKIAQLRQLLQFDPDDSLTWYLLGNELLHDDQFQPAAEALHKALQLNPDHTAAMRRLGDAYRQQGRTRQARDAYEQAIALAERTGDLQVAREARAFLKKIERQPDQDAES